MFAVRNGLVQISEAANVAPIAVADALPEEAEPLLAEAREVFERLEATPWLERAARAAGVGREAEAVT